jgi:putative transposase
MRKARNTPGDYVYHVINRANGRLRIFQKEWDFLAFEKVLTEALVQRPIRLLDWCVMPNHWHFVVWPRKDDEITEFFRWLTHTHTQRWHAHHGTVGTGHVYQGRFKAFPIQKDDHLAEVLRYVQLNPLRAGMVKHAIDWRWGSCHIRQRGPESLSNLLSDWPIDQPRNWSAWLNEPQDSSEVEQIALSIKRSRPFGDSTWVKRVTTSLGLEWTVRPRGRPRKIAK